MVETQIPLNPFPGLRPFKASEANLFYGREGQTEELIHILERTHFLTVVGVSGSGKSSLVRAGLLPSLSDERTSGAAPIWRVSISRPEDDPIGNLAKELNKIPELQRRTYNDDGTESISLNFSLDIIETLLRRGSRGLIEAVWQARLPNPVKLLIVIDQFEELFRFKQVRPRQDAINEAAAFVKLLIQATKKQQELPIYVVLTMRSDFLGECAQFRDLPEAINEGQYLIPRMTRDQIRSAIEQPIAVDGATIAPQLVNRLLNTVGDNPDQLPILQHALMQTWNVWVADHQPNEPLDLKHYDATGGMEQALSRHADSIYEGLPSDRHQKIAEVLFKRLTERDAEGYETRRPTALSEICDIASATETRATEAEVIEVVDAFRAEGQSFLMPPVDEVETLTANSKLDISHESLMRVWEKLKGKVEGDKVTKGWIAEEAESAETYRRLAQAAVCQRELWRGIDLASAWEWKTKEQPNQVWARRYNPKNTSPSLFQQAIDFLNKSEQKRLHDLNRERRIGITLITLSIATAITAIMASIQYVNAQNSRLISNLSNAEASFALNDQLAALVTALEASEQIQQTSITNPVTRLSAIATLRQIVYSIQERDRFIHGVQTGDNLNNKGGRVYSASYSPDGRWIASGGGDSTVKLWLPNESQPHTLEGHTEAVHDVAFSPDGQLLASGSADDTIKIWQLDGTLVQTMGNPGRVGDLTFDVEDISFSPDGTLIAAAYKDDTIKLWDLNGTQIKTFAGHQGYVTAVNFSPTGDRLVSGSVDGTVKLWNLDGTLLQTWNHSEGVQDVAFSSDGQWVASAGDDNEVKLWRADGGSSQIPQVLLGHNDTIYSVRFSPDGQTVASASKDNTIKLWEVKDGRLLNTFQGHRQSILSVDFSPDGETLISASFDNTIRLWNRAPTNLEHLSGLADIRSISISPNGQLLAYGSDDGTLTLWNRVTRTAPKVLAVNTEAILSTAFSSDSQYLLTGDTDSTVKLWRVGEDQPLRTLEMDDGDDWGQGARAVNAVGFSPNDQQIAAASSNGMITLWNINGTRLRTFQAHDKEIYGVSFSPNGTQIASASADNTVKLWTLEGRRLQTFSGHQDQVYSIRFSPDAQELVSASADRTIRRWRLDGTEIGQPLRGHEDAVRDAIFAPDGNTIASASYDNTVRLWSKDGNPIRTLEGHHDFVYSLSFSPDGKTLASASADDSIILWNLDLDNLIQRGCQWVFAYIQKNPGFREDSLSLCSDRQP
ncbi:WD40 repeat domain-containing protein [Oscillatoria sp. FACHB-1407]|uniref:nSTAND1 domain-containing NTPase n=1 Tax=Oscillatoria sp. FACHB-1407 TaxID=2692847 RepID=UPI001682BDE0|nr:WD40 repeat domain-containing protein [Oscillatoria sp. FACHB-1407]MBD2461338.1 WD40 repeat domain-containing protein [Oscillatoria sp. FACHB-1407]